MAFTSEEIASDLVWRYTERIRSADAEPLSEEELEELVAVLRSIPATHEALVAELTDEGRQAAVRRRLEEALSQAPAPPAATPPLPSRPVAQPFLVSAWRFRVACGMAAALAIALGTVGLWHHPPAQKVVQRMVVPRDISGVEAMDEHQAHELMPKMVHNQLTPKQEKDLMGHMLVCPGCFNHYVELKQHVKDLARVGTRMALLIRR